MKDDAMNLDKETPKQAAAEEEKKVDTATDKSSEAETTPEQEEEKKEEPEAVKLSFKERQREKLNNVSDKMKTKFPKAHEKTSAGFNLLVEVWRETFPNAE